VAATGGVLTVSLLIAPAGVSGRWQAYPARTPPPMRATRAAARREGHGLPAGRCGRGGRRWKGSPPRRGRRGGEPQAGTLRLRATALDRDTPLLPPLPQDGSHSPTAPQAELLMKIVSASHRRPRPGSTGQ